MGTIDRQGVATLGSRRFISALAAALVAGAALAGTAGARRTTTVLPTLYVAYSTTSCTFTITSDSGATVTTIAPGEYQVVITAEDFSGCGSNLPDFELNGPGVAETTPVDSGDGNTAEFDATFAPSSTYVAMDGNDPGPSTVTFVTQASGAPPTEVLPTGSSGPTSTTSTGGSSGSPINGNTANAPSYTTLLGTLEATVSSSGKLTLTLKGKAVKSLDAGRYTIAVVDHSKTSGFIIQGLHQAATTVSSAAFVGSRKATIKLTPGQWYYFPTFVGKKTYFIVVSV